jgi:hypothetical protein
LGLIKNLAPPGRLIRHCTWGGQKPSVVAQTYSKRLSRPQSLPDADPDAALAPLSDLSLHENRSNQLSVWRFPYRIQTSLKNRLNSRSFLRVASR